MIRQLLITTVLVSVAATAMAGLARMPTSQTDGAHSALSSINPVLLLRRLADDEKPDTTTDKSRNGVPTGVRAGLGEEPAVASRSPTLLNTLAEGSPRRWSF